MYDSSKLIYAEGQELGLLAMKELQEFLEASMLKAPSSAPEDPRLDFKFNGNGRLLMNNNWWNRTLRKRR